MPCIYCRFILVGIIIQRLRALVLQQAMIIHAYGEDSLDNFDLNNRI